MFGFRSKRQIFHYHDGQRKRAADPIVVIRAMCSHPTLDLETHLQQFNSDDDKLRNEAGGVLVKATREIFDVKGFTDSHRSGLTERETLDVLDSFIAYIDTLKKNGSGQPT